MTAEKLIDPNSLRYNDVGFPDSKPERILRRLLCSYSRMPGAYYDDGEASATEHGITIDFMRDAPADIESALYHLGQKRFQLAKGKEQSNMSTEELRKAEMMEVIKRHGESFSAILDLVREYLDAIEQVAAKTPYPDSQTERDRFVAADPYRWVGMADDHLRLGLMLLTRAVTQPTDF
jgi:hypothetical protein